MKRTAAAIAVVPAMDPRDRDLPPLRVTRGEFLPMLPLLCTPLPEDVSDPAAARAVLALLQTATHTLRNSSSFALHSTGVTAALGPIDSKRNQQTFAPSMDVLAGADDLAKLRSDLLAGGIPEADASLVPLSLVPLKWMLSPHSFYLPTQVDKAMRHAPKPKARWGFVVASLRLVALPPAADEAFGYGLLGPAIPLGRRGLPHGAASNPTLIVDPATIVPLGSNPFSALDAAPADDAEDEGDDKDPDREEANETQRAVVADLAWRALKIPPVPRELMPPTRTARAREKRRKAAERRNAVERERERQRNAVAESALCSGAVPENGPWCREFDTVVGHMAGAESRIAEELRHTRTMVEKAHRKSDAAALEELCRAGFINTAQRDAALSFLVAEKKPSQQRKVSSQALELPAGIITGKTDQERLRELRLLDFITDEELKTRTFELDAQLAVRAQLRAIENDWFLLSRHQAGPLADTLARTKPSFAMVGPLAASLIAGSDPKFLISANCRAAAAFIGEYPAPRSVGDAKEHDGPLSVEEQIIETLQGSELSELEQQLPSVAAQYRALVRLERRMAALQAHRRARDFAGFTNTPSRR